MPQTKPIVSIENVVVSATVEQELDLVNIKKKFPEIEYHPEQFPGLVHRMIDPKTVILIFASGRLVCTGGKSTSEVFRSIHSIHTTLEEKDLIFYD